jgi:DNA polymerase-3 subunit epsilon
MEAAEIFKKLNKRIIIFDTETTGVNPGSICQLSYFKIRETGITPKNYYFAVDYVEPGAQQVHGLSVEILKELSKGMVFKDKVNEIYNDFKSADMLVGHNISFDIKFLTTEFERNGIYFRPVNTFCTMKGFTNICKIIKTGNGGYKWPSLAELSNFMNIDQETIDYQSKRLFGLHTAAHDARGDIVTTYLCYLEGLKKNFISINH